MDLALILNHDDDVAQHFKTSFHGSKDRIGTLIESSIIIERKAPLKKRRLTSEDREAHKRNLQNKRQKRYRERQKSNQDQLILEEQQLRDEVAALNETMEEQSRKLPTQATKAEMDLLMAKRRWTAALAVKGYLPNDMNDKNNDTNRSSKVAALAEVSFNTKIVQVQAMNDEGGVFRVSTMVNIMGDASHVFKFVGQNQTINMVWFVHFSKANTSPQLVLASASLTDSKQGGVCQNITEKFHQILED